VIAAALDRAGHRVAVAHAVSEDSRARAEALIPQAELVEVPEVLQRCDLVVLSVPDDVLPGLVAGLAENGHIRPGQFIVHCSGRYGIDVLAPATDAGALPLALHPVMTLNGLSIDLDRLAGCPFGVTAPQVLRPVAEALVVEMGGEPVWVEESDRTLYHAALATASNHLVTLTVEAMELLTAAGVAEPGRMLAPLMGASLDNALRFGVTGLTGPVVRGDAGTVAGHVAAVTEHSPQSRAAYVAMARLTADKALAAGRLRPAQAEALLEVLAEPEARP
jgi:predicted short-subunit dehydrogenase-like oxidoreductase (DUF2520 family)